MVASDFNTNHSNAVAGEQLADEQLDSVQSMQAGKRLVITGCIVAVLGIVLHCYFSFSAAFEVPAAARESLLLVGAGVVLWFWGAIKYFTGAICADAREELF
ncbi:MAG: hypothetical protein K2Y39_08605 [Candidatus Obscuribacterales bacterium]|nr:hypothetical protein [Candidatus Obscuribacterales bacterium]